uniref:Mercuric resistance operon regulatory protein n=1 Tax=Rheinheimera sp. BAL341 TaxID=1708203 RepID=A0A486XJM9_9GAMM
MKASDVAKSAGISKETLRYYEKTGLISTPIRQANGYRNYPASVLDELRFIKLAQTVGFTLNEIKPAIPFLKNPDPRCPQLIQALKNQISRVDQKMGNLVVAKAILNRWLSNIENK